MRRHQGDAPPLSWGQAQVRLDKRKDCQSAVLPIESIATGRGSVTRTRRSLLVVWCPAWIIASVVGFTLPQVALFVGLFPSQPLILPGDVRIEPSSLAVGVTFAAFCQYIVLSLLIGRVSWVAVMWIPVTSVVTVAASTAGKWFWSSSDGVRDLALLQFIFGGPLYPVLAVPLGLAQGVLLAKLYGRKAAIWLWCSATIVVAVIFGSLAGEERVLGTMEEHILYLVALAVIYGVMTGLALLVIPSRKVRPATRVAT
jgi:hypothetical protein